MRKILVTGGTVFVSRYIAEYYATKGDEVYVLNRNTKKQSEGVKLVEADRHQLGDVLRDYSFDVIIDTAYNAGDVEALLNAVGDYKEYILISSSAVYPEYEPQPFTEETTVGENKYWGLYGTNKIKAEEVLMSKVPNAYILRPPYLYGPMNNVYREAFAFDCALNNRRFYLPKDGNMKMQFLYIEDLCKIIDAIFDKKPDIHIFNVGNKETVSIKEWVKMCYEVVGKDVDFVNVYEDIEQRNYFSFHDYEYYLDVSKQSELIKTTTDMEEGLKRAYEWYVENGDNVNKKPYIEFIDNNF